MWVLLAEVTLRVIGFSSMSLMMLRLRKGGAPPRDLERWCALTIQVLADGGYQISGQTMPLDQVRRSILARTKIDGAKLRVRIRTDRQTDYEHIGALLKICAITGVTDVFFAVYEERMQ